ncbi:unnamed protein product [Acanthoscelides obtectus]|nr:unnamed protein product [Acanthoscelides obtectus]CAK1659379.1 Myosin light chain alkali [Acanthoscelides obtectus]
MLRALNLNPTLATVEKVGGTKKKNEKKLKIDEFLPIFSQVKKDKEQGNFDDFLECLKLYDKEENGTMMAAELAHTLLSLGERLSDAETEEVLADCMGQEDDEGFIPYERLSTRSLQREEVKICRKFGIPPPKHSKSLTSEIQCIYFEIGIICYFENICYPLL